MTAKEMKALEDLAQAIISEDAALKEMDKILKAKKKELLEAMEVAKVEVVETEKGNIKFQERKTLDYGEEYDQKKAALDALKKKLEITGDTKVLKTTRFLKIYK